MENQKGNGVTMFSIVVAIILVATIIYGFIQKSKQNDDQVINIGEEASATQNESQNDTLGDVSDNQENKEKDMDTENTQARVAKNGDVLVMNYTGKLTNGTVFDSNVDPKFGHVTPFEFTLGAGMVIAGWDEGLLGMKVGEKKTLTIAPEKAYGARSPSPLIPANSTLIFDVELVAIK